MIYGRIYGFFLTRFGNYVRAEWTFFGYYPPPPPYCTFETRGISRAPSELFSATTPSPGRLPKSQYVSEFHLGNHVSDTVQIIIQGSKLTLARSPQASSNHGGWVDFLHRSSARASGCFNLFRQLCVQMLQSYWNITRMTIKPLPLTERMFVERISTKTSRTSHGPWDRFRFQVTQNWLIPDAATTMRRAIRQRLRTAWADRRQRSLLGRTESDKQK